MADIDATARYDNVLRRLNVYLESMKITGVTKIVLIGETGFVPDEHKPFVRLTADNVGQRNDGRYSATQTAERVEMLITADVFFPDGTADTPHNAYTIMQAASDVAHALRRLNLSFNDYSSDPANPTVVSGARIRTLLPPSISRLPPTGGFERRQVACTVQWHLRHTA